MPRDAKGRFCKADTETPDLPVQEEIGYGLSFDFNKNLPPHEVMRAYKVKEHTPAGTPLCYPYNHRPDEPKYLYSFEEAKHKLEDSNLETQLHVFSDIDEEYRVLRDSNKLDFVYPANFESPKYSVGAPVYAVKFLRGISMVLSACKGIIIGMQYHYEPYDPVNGGMMPGWNYCVYHQSVATEEDTYYNNKPGDILHHEDWIPESGIFTDKDEALHYMLVKVSRLMAAYSRIHKKNKNLKPEDVELWDDTK